MGRLVVVVAASALLLAAVASALSAQTGTIVGTITDAQSGAAIGGTVLILARSARAS